MGENILNMTGLKYITDLFKAIYGAEVLPFFNILVSIIVTIVIAVIVLKLTNSLISRLMRRGIIPKPVAERAKKAISITIYLIVALTIIYELTRVHELLYLWIGMILVVMLANWSILADFISYFMLTTSVGLRIGDYIEIPGTGITGRVADIGLAYTKIKTGSGALLFLPNHYIVMKPLKRHTPEETSVCLEVTVTADNTSALTDVEKKLRDTITIRFKNLVKPRLMKIVLRRVASNEANYEVCLPIVGLEGREQVVNSLMKQLASALSEYKAEIKVKT